MKTQQLITVLVLSVLIGAAPAYATMCGGDHADGKTHDQKEASMDKKASVAAAQDMGDEGQEELVKVGNTTCPVSGQKVGTMGDVVHVEYDGKVYNLCCSMCKQDFLKNPEKYSAIAEAEAAENENTKAMDEKDQKAMDGHQGHDH